MFLARTMPTAFRVTLLGVVAAAGCGQSSSPMPSFDKTVGFCS